jgi:hypothetical protein
MDQNWISGLGIPSSGGHSLRDWVDQDRLNGLATILIGMSQLPMAFVLADSTGFEIPLFVIVVGSVVLIAIGVNVFRGMEAFEVEWSESERVAWLDTVMRCMFAIVVTAATFWIVA